MNHHNLFVEFFLASKFYNKVATFLSFLMWFSRFFLTFKRERLMLSKFLFPTNSRCLEFIPTLFSNNFIRRQELVVLKMTWKNGALGARVCVLIKIKLVVITYTNMPPYTTQAKSFAHGRRSFKEPPFRGFAFSRGSEKCDCKIEKKLLYRYPYFQRHRRVYSFVCVRAKCQVPEEALT